MSKSLTVKPNNASRTAIEFPHMHNLLEEMERLTRRISERAFNLFQQRGGSDGRDWDDWFKAESEVLKAVPIEISESPDSYTIRAEVPGFKIGELSIQADSNRVYIHGKAESKKETSEKGAVTYSEVTAKEVARRVELPSAIDSTKVTAQLNEGILELTLPKMEPPKTIEIKVA